MKNRPTIEAVKQGRARADLDGALDVVALCVKEWGDEMDFEAGFSTGCKIINQGRAVLRRHGRMT